MRTRDLGLLILRLGVGGTVAAHGTQKLFGWFGGPGREGAAGMFEKMGFPRSEEAATAAAVIETAGGTLLGLGLATPAVGAAVAGNMRTAADVHRPNGFFAMNGGFELPFNLGVAAGVLALTGPGRLSFDHLLRNRLARPWMGIVGIAAAVAAGTAIARTRRPPTQKEEEEVVDVRDEVALAERAEVDVSI